MIGIKQHKTLNPKLWNPDNTLKPEVLDASLKVVARFLHILRSKYNISFEPNEIKDIFMYGSNSGYFYTKKSDIDICIVVDLLRLRTQNPFIDLRKFFKLYYLEWQKYHEEKIYGYSLDISFDDIYFPQHQGRHRAGPQYSLIDNEWIYENVLLSPKEFKLICKDSDKIYKRCVRKFRSIKRKGCDYKELNSLYREITMTKNFAYDSKKEQLITPIAITWRRLKNSGAINEMRKILKEKRSEKLSLK